MKKITIALSVVIGMAASYVLADTGIDPCNPTVTDCTTGHYGKVGSPKWVCCADHTHTECQQYFKQKWICNTANDMPAVFGWTFDNPAPDKVNLNCDPTNNGSCF